METEHRACINVVNVAAAKYLGHAQARCVFRNKQKHNKAMKLTKIEVSCTFNAGNYESVKLGGEWEISESETLTDAIQAATAAIRAEWERIKAQKVETPATVEKAPQNEEKAVNKRIVEFGSPLLQKIVDRVMADKNVTMDVITDHYDLTEDARKVIEAAIRLNK